jgi:hypothetical protein
MGPTRIQFIAATLDDTTVSIQFSAVSWGLSYALLLGVLVYMRRFKEAGIGVGIVLTLAILAGTF